MAGYRGAGLAHRATRPLRQLPASGELRNVMLGIFTSVGPSTSRVSTTFARGSGEKGKGQKLSVAGKGTRSRITPDGPPLRKDPHRSPAGRHPNQF